MKDRRHFVFHQKSDSMFKASLATFVFISSLISCTTPNPNDDQHYPFPFSPLNGIVSSEELPYRSELCLNGRWDFMPVYSDSINEFELPEPLIWDPVQIKIPSPWNVNSLVNSSGGDFVTFPSYPNVWGRANMGWMKREFVIPENWNRKIIKLHFEAIAGFSKIFINGRLAAENYNISSSIQIDATPFIQRGMNKIIVGVAKSSLNIAGIWQDVHLVAYPEVSIDDVLINTDVKNNELIVVVKVHNYSSAPLDITSAAVVRPWKKERSGDINELPLPNGDLGAEVLNFSTAKKISIEPGAIENIILKQKVDGQLDHWTPAHPNLYGITVELNSGENSPIDKKHVRFGWRQFTIDGSRLLLNGTRIVLKGDLWHLTGIPQMTRRYAYSWFQMLKDANANAVRFTAQPYPSFYRDVADEMGICVLDESDLWSGDSDSSVFIPARYALSPLAFGMNDTTRAPDLSDGIFFPDFKEGVPGIQPERLGPYTSTLNPGYDKRLPLYKPAPLFDAMKPGTNY